MVLANRIFSIFVLAIFFHMICFFVHFKILKIVSVVCWLPSSSTNSYCPAIHAISVSSSSSTCLVPILFGSSSSIESMFLSSHHLNHEATNRSEDHITWHGVSAIGPLVQVQIPRVEFVVAERGWTLWCQEARKNPKENFGVTPIER